MDENVNILIVDDEEPIRRLLNRLLEMDDYVCALATGAAQARTALENQNFDLLLCDMKMLGESGMDLTRYVTAEYPDTAVIMVTAVDDPEVAKTALEIGAYGYIIKPFKPNEVTINVTNALRRRKLEIENRTYRDKLEHIVAQRTAELQATLGKLQKSMEGVIEAIAMTVESRDPYTAGHQRRVAALAFAIAGEMGLSEDRMLGIKMAGEIHDLGKISIPAEILAKPSRLSDTEFSLIKTHPQVGYDILKGIEFPWPMAQMVIQHHEKVNGSGYPQGLLGDGILMESRILVVADVAEAMASHRPYRPALGIDAALEEIAKNRGLYYDCGVVDACLKLFREKGFKLE